MSSGHIRDPLAPGGFVFLPRRCVCLPIEQQLPTDVSNFSSHQILTGGGEGASENGHPIDPETKSVSTRAEKIPVQLRFFFPLNLFDWRRKKIEGDDIQLANLASRSLTDH